MTINILDDTVSMEAKFPPEFPSESTTTRRTAEPRRKMRREKKQKLWNPYHLLDLPAKSNYLSLSQFQLRMESRCWIEVSYKKVPTGEYILLLGLPCNHVVWRSIYLAFHVINNYSILLTLLK